MLPLLGILSRGDGVRECGEGARGTSSPQLPLPPNSWGAGMLYELRASAARPSYTNPLAALCSGPSKIQSSQAVSESSKVQIVRERTLCHPHPRDQLCHL